MSRRVFSQQGTASTVDLFSESDPRYGPCRSPRKLPRGFSLVFAAFATTHEISLRTDLYRIPFPVVLASSSQPGLLLYGLTKVDSRLSVDPSGEAWLMSLCKGKNPGRTDESRLVHAGSSAEISGNNISTVWFFCKRSKTGPLRQV